jgi:hypothetical protein
VRRGVKLGAIVGAGFFLAQVFLRKQAPPATDRDTGTGTSRTPAQPNLSHASPTGLNSDSAPAETEAPAKVAAPEDDEEPPPWVDPQANGSCPPTHPVKAKLSSKIFHVPGGLAYDRTTPDRCYRDADAAESDGFRAAKR